MPITENILQAITHTFLHSLWQGIPAALLAGLVLLLTKRSRASLRYNLLGAVLLLFLAGTAFTFWLEMQSAPPPAPVATAAAPAMAYAAAPQPDMLSRFMQLIDGHTSQIMMIWALVFLLKCIRMGAGFYHIFRIRHSNTIQPPGEWAGKLRQLALSLGIHTPVRLLESARVQMPFTIGWLKPCIYVPAGLLAQLPADQLEAILLHELAHIRRRDYLVNILQRFAETIFFFNPALLWISACIREEREACCDDIAVAHTPHQSSYLQALVAFEDAKHQQMELGMAFGQKKFYLLERVKRILTNENKKLTIMEKGILLLGLAGITAFSFIPAAEQPSPELREIKLEVMKDTTVKPFKTEKVQKDSVMLRMKVRKVNKDSIKARKWKTKDSGNVVYLNFDTTAGAKIYKAYAKVYQQQDTQIAKMYYSMVISDTARFRQFKGQNVMLNDTLRSQQLNSKLKSRDSAYISAYLKNRKGDSAYNLTYKVLVADGKKLKKLHPDSVTILKKKLYSKDSVIKIQRLELDSLKRKLKLKSGEPAELKGSSALRQNKEEHIAIQYVRALQTEFSYGASDGLFVAEQPKLKPAFNKTQLKEKFLEQKKEANKPREVPKEIKWHAPKHYKPTFREKATKALPAELQKSLLPPVSDC